MIMAVQQAWLWWQAGGRKTAGGRHHAQAPCAQGGRRHPRRAPAVFIKRSSKRRQAAVHPRNGRYRLRRQAGEHPGSRRRHGGE